MKSPTKAIVINRYASPWEVASDLPQIINKIKDMDYREEDIEHLERNLLINFPMNILRRLQDLFVSNLSRAVSVRAAHFISRDHYSPDPSLLSRLAIRFVTSSHPISVIIASNTLIFLFKKQFIWGHQITQYPPLDSSVIEVDLNDFK